MKGAGTLHLGGNSFNNGVNFVSDNYSAKFIMQKDNNYTIITEKRLEISGVRKIVRKIPLIKGLFSMFSGSRLIPAIVAMSIFEDVAMHSRYFDMPSIYLSSSIVIIAFSLICFAYIIKKILYKVNETWAYHGAEHKTIYAYEHGMELTLENVRSCPRVARRCGTNFLVFFLLFFTAFSFVLDYASAVLVLSYVLAYELFDLTNGDKMPVIKWFFKFGYWCQQHLFTREPSDIQILASIGAMKKLVELSKNN